MGMREKLIELIQSAVGGCSAYWAGLIADYLVANGVTIPVRCKACKQWKHLEHIGCTDFVKACMLANYMVGATGYCVYGERRTDENPDL